MPRFSDMMSKLQQSRDAIISLELSVLCAVWQKYHRRKYTRKDEYINIILLQMSQTRTKKNTQSNAFKKRIFGHITTVSIDSVSTLLFCCYFSAWMYYKHINKQHSVRKYEWEDGVCGQVRKDKRIMCNLPIITTPLLFYTQTKFWASVHSITSWCDSFPICKMPTTKWESTLFQRRFGLQYDNSL